MVEQVFCSDVGDVGRYPIEGMTRGLRSTKYMQWLLYDTVNKERLLRTIQVQSMHQANPKPKGRI